MSKLSTVGSPWGLLFASIMALVLGVTIASVELILKPVQVINAGAAKTGACQIFFVRGNEDPTADGDQKIYQFTHRTTNSGSELSLSEGDLNTFLRRSLQSSSSGAAPSKTSINLHITDRYFQMGIVSYPEFIKYPLCIQTRGIFQKEAGSYRFVAHRTYVGSLPLPQFLAQSLVDAALAKAFPASADADFITSWQHLQYVHTENGTLFVSWANQMDK